MINVTEEQFSRLVHIYNSLNVVGSQVDAGEPVSHGQREALGESVVALYRLINEIQGATPAEIATHQDVDVDL